MRASVPDQADAQTESLIRQMSLTSADIERRLQYVGFVEEDAKRVTTLAEIVISHLDTFTSAFFDHLALFDAASGLTKNRAALGEARQLKKEHLRALVSGEYGARYVE